MLLDSIRTLYAYNAWANDQILNAAAQLDAAQLLTAGGASFDSVRDTLVHVMSGQWIWLTRAKGTSPRALHNPADFPDVATLRADWQTIEDDTRAFIDGLDEPALARIVEYVNTAGEPNAYPLWQILMHQANHATQHRSEIAMLLTQFGHSPGWLDLLYYIDVKEAR